MSQSQRCTKCGLAKPNTAFRGRSDRSGYLDSWCKDCRNIDSRIYSKTHRETINAAHRSWHRKNTGRQAVYNARWRARHPEENRDLERRYRSRHSEWLRLRRLIEAVVLSDTYVRRLIVLTSNLHCAAVTPAMITVRRIQVMVKRDLACWGF